MRDSKAVPGAVVAIQTFRDFPQEFHPHQHILVSDGSFHANGMFSVSTAIDTKTLEQIIRHKVLKMLLAKGKITQDMIALLSKWQHSGFIVFFGHDSFMRKRSVHIESKITQIRFKQYLYSSNLLPE